MSAEGKRRMESVQRTSAKALTQHGFQAGSK